ncbi:preprotein translocase subunit SecY [Candidatus Berkelbacteria bacterium]|nr:preprotein translocase subunit SecY [Candidatus Berkelbacteria bacterium]
MFKTLAQLWRLPEVRRRILLTILLLTMVRFVAHVPLPGINVAALANLFQTNQLFGLLDLFSGGSLAKFSVAFMGVGPYITASIIMQLLAHVIPSLEALQKEGEQGRMKINQYTRYLTVPLGLVQAFGLLSLLRSGGVLAEITISQLLTILITGTAGTVLLMWLGELISESGIGNGISLIITIGILARAPAKIQNVINLVAGGGIFDSKQFISIITFLAIALAMVVFIVLINEAVRKIPISYARRSREGLAPVDTYLPIKIAAAGVIPIIFAVSVIVFPSIIASFFARARSDFLANAASAFLNLYQPNGVIYSVTYFALVIAFTYFYTAIIFRPQEIAENLNKQGGFIPGVRPGSETAHYLKGVISRLTLPGSLFLGLIATAPFLIQLITKTQSLVVGGTGVLIVVSVAIETYLAIRAHLLTRTYDAY